jgi:hypothetical protein
MVDREARDRAALLLRRFAAGRLTNDEFDEAYPGSAGDRALPEVGGAAWHLHSDGEVHRLTGEYALARLTRRDVARWVVFLHTDLEYEWPAFDWYRFVDPVWNWLTRGRAERRWRDDFEAFQRRGEYRVWPFLRGADFVAARRRPRLLAGRAP